MVLHFHFTFKLFLGHTQKRERVREREREREKERRESREPLLMTDRATRKVELAEIVQSFDRRGRPPRSPRSREAPRQLRSRLHADRDRAKHRANRNLALAPIAIARSVDRDLAFAPIAISRGIAPIAASHRTQSPLSVPSSLNLTRFDDFFSWVLFVFVY